MRAEELDYPLPKHLIASEPAQRRDDCRLMVLHRGRQSISHHLFRDLPTLLRSGDLVVLNNTRVVRARFYARRSTGGRCEGLFVRERELGQWEVMLRSKGRLRPGERLKLIERSDVELELRERLGHGTWLVQLHPAVPAVQLLDEVGQVPLPPYIKRSPRPEDQDWYQTVYAQEWGSVAAPTAGLHFTRELLDELQERGIGLAYVTLHVGPGTFRPIKKERVEEHDIHAEWCRVPAETVEAIRQCRARGGRVVAVGTTVVRTLETAAASGTLQPYAGETRLYIYPPYQFRAVDALITNFHLPRSTLLALVFAFAGVELTRRAYAEAVRREYRFYSYGDAMLIL